MDAAVRLHLRDEPDDCKTVVEVNRLRNVADFSLDKPLRERIGRLQLGKLHDIPVLTLLREQLRALLRHVLEETVLLDDLLARLLGLAVAGGVHLGYLLVELDVERLLFVYLLLSDDSQVGGRPLLKIRHVPGVRQNRRLERRAELRTKSLHDGLEGFLWTPDRHHEIHFDPLDVLLRRRNARLLRRLTHLLTPHERLNCLSREVLEIAV